MSEPKEPQNALNGELRAAIQEHATAHLALIDELVENIGGPGANIDDVLYQPMKDPSSARQDAEEPDWSDEQIAKARELAHIFGYGAENNVGSGLEGGVRIIEGGLAWKIVAEHKAADDENNPGALTFAGSPYRPLKEEELAFIKDRLGMNSSVLTTEYDFAAAYARRQLENTVQEEYDIGFGYQIAPGNPTVAQPTGQLKRLGQTEAGQDIVLLRVDREEYEEDGEKKYRHQPSSEILMRFVSDVLEASGQHETAVGLITANAYASRIPSTMHAGLKHGRPFGMAMYGRATLAEVQGMPMKPDTPLNQLPGELRVMHDNLRKLLAEVSEE